MTVRIGRQPELLRHGLRIAAGIIRAVIDVGVVQIQGQHGIALRIRAMGGEFDPIPAPFHFGTVTVRLHFRIRIDVGRHFPRIVRDDAAECDTPAGRAGIGMGRQCATAVIAADLRIRQQREPAVRLVQQLAAQTVVIRIILIFAEKHIVRVAVMSSERAGQPNRERLPGDRQVDHALQAALGVVSQARVRIGGPIRFRISGVDADRAAGHVSAQMHPLRALKDFDPLDVEQIDERVIRARQIGAVDERGHTRLGTGRNEVAADTAQIRLAQHLVGLDDEARGYVLEMERVMHTGGTQRLAGKLVHRLGHGLSVGWLPFGADDNGGQARHGAVRNVGSTRRVFSSDQTGGLTQTSDKQESQEIVHCFFIIFQEYYARMADWALFLSAYQPAADNIHL